MLMFFCSPEYKGYPRYEPAKEEVEETATETVEVTHGRSTRAKKVQTEVKVVKKVKEKEQLPFGTHQAVNENEPLQTKGKVFNKPHSNDWLLSSFFTLKQQSANKK
jgi:hypothetical protein